jgi:hypothetical protein
MRTGRLLLLSLVVIGLGAYIWLVERHAPTTDEARADAEKVFRGLDRDDVVGLDITNSHGSFSLAKSDGGWKIVAPSAYPADETAISSLLGSLVNLKAERRFKAGEVKPADYGLDKPSMSVTLTDAKGTKHALEVGAAAALGSNRAVSTNGSDVMLVPGWFANDLDKDLNGWRSKDVVDVTADDLASLEIVTGEDRIQLARSAGLWRLLQPIDDLADRDHVRTLVSNLNAMRVQEFLPADTNLAELGLEPPRRRVTLVASGEGGTATVLEFGNTRTKGGATQVACRRDGKELFWVDDRAEASLGRAPVLWRSTVVYPFDSWGVSKLSLTTADGTTANLDGADGRWKFADGGEADASNVLQRLSALAGLKASAYDLVAPGTPEMGRVELTLKETGDESASAPITFTFYRPLTADGKALVKVSARSGLIGVDPKDVQSILGDLGALHPATPTPAVTPTAVAPVVPSPAAAPKS